MESWARSFYPLWLGQFLAILGFSVATPFTPLFLQDLGVRDLAEVEWWSGVLFGVAAIVQMVVTPVWGVLSDSYGRKMMVQRAMFGGAVVLFAMAFSRNTYDLLVLRVLQGLTVGTVAASVPLAAEISPRELLARNLGLMQMAVFLGASLGPMFGGLLADRFGFRATFMITATFLVLGGMVVTALVKEQFVPMPRASRMNVAGIWRDICRAAASPYIWGLSVAVLLTTAGSQVTTPILPLVVQALGVDAGSEASYTGLIFGAAAVTSASAAMIIGRYANRWGYQRALLWCTIGAALAAVPQGWLANFYLLLVARAVQGIFLGGLVPLLNAIVGLVTAPERRGTVFGLTSGVNSLGYGMGPLLGGAMAPLLGFSWTFVISGIVLMIGAVAITRIQLWRI